MCASLDIQGLQLKCRQIVASLPLGLGVNYHLSEIVANRPHFEKHHFQTFLSLCNHSQEIVPQHLKAHRNSMLHRS